MTQPPYVLIYWLRLTVIISLVERREVTEYLISGKAVSARLGILGAASQAERSLDKTDYTFAGAMGDR